MFDALFNLLNRAGSLNQDFAVEAMDTPETIAKVIELNTIEQMFEKGVNALGEEMGNYSPNTILIKMHEGARYDHITGKDTGEMYASTKARFEANGDLVISMNTIKDGEDVSQTRWGHDLPGLIPESLAELKPINRDNIIKALRKFL